MKGTATSVSTRVARIDWPAVIDEVNQYGCALTSPILDPDECRSISGLYDRAEFFRATMDKARHRFAPASIDTSGARSLPSWRSSARRSIHACFRSPETGP
jgi:hypothetical protein